MEALFQVTLHEKKKCPIQNGTIETCFQVNEKRFDILKEAYVRGLKNFAADQPHQHAVYFNSVVLAGIQ